MQVTDEEAKQIIAANLRALRERASISLAEVARRCDTYPTAIKRIEDGESMPGVGLMTRIAAALGAKPAALLDPPRKK